MKYLIIGGGGIGGSLAAAMAENGLDITVIARGVHLQAIKEHGLKMVNDEGALRETAAKVIADNPQAVADFKGGKEKAIGALLGQTMCAMKGKANPGMVNQVLRELLK